MGFFRTLILIDVSILMLLCFAPGIPPHENFEVIQVPTPQELKGPLTLNDYLDFGERLHEGTLEGPESIAIKNDHEIFVGLLNGDIVKIWGKKLENSKVVFHNPSCESEDNGMCGRPLGLRYLKDDRILVADSVLGVYIFDAKTGTMETIVDSRIRIENKLPLVTNDLDIDQEGNIYWSHSSSMTNLTESVLGILVGPSGRLLKFDVKNKRNEVLMDNLYFANGVQLSSDESFVLVAESMGRKIHRYWIKGAKKGKSEIFLTDLPGSPDNIRPRREGGFYVSLVSTTDPEMLDAMSIIGRYPFARRLMARLMTIIKAAADCTHAVFPNSFSKEISASIFHFDTLRMLTPSKYVIVLEVDEGGNIIGSMQGKSGLMEAVSEAQRVGDTLLFGSPFMKFLAKLDVSTLQKLKQNPELVSRPDTKEEL